MCINMLLHTKNVDNVDNFVNNLDFSIFSRFLNVDNSVKKRGTSFDNFFPFISYPPFFVHYFLSGYFSGQLHIKY